MPPRVTNVDRDPAYPKAIMKLKRKGTLPHGCELRPIKYLNNLIEQDHPSIKRRTNPGMGFWSFDTAVGNGAWQGEFTAAQILSRAVQRIGAVSEAGCGHRQYPFDVLLLLDVAHLSHQAGAGTYKSDLGLYCTASAKWDASMLAVPVRSAIVLASLRVR